jgi:hypothetical protein
LYPSSFPCVAHDPPISSSSVGEVYKLWSHPHTLKEQWHEIHWYHLCTPGFHTDLPRFIAVRKWKQHSIKLFCFTP